MTKETNSTPILDGNGAPRKEPNLHTFASDRRPTFREKLEWLEEAETLTLSLRAGREARERSAKESES